MSVSISSGTLHSGTTQSVGHLCLTSSQHSTNKHLNINRGSNRTMQSKRRHTLSWKLVIVIAAGWTGSTKLDLRSSHIIWKSFLPALFSLNPAAQTLWLTVCVFKKLMTNWKIHHFTDEWGIRSEADRRVWLGAQWFNLSSHLQRFQVVNCN